MTLDNIYKLFDIYLRKNMGGGYVPPEEKDLVTDRAQVEVFEEMKPAYGMDVQISDALFPFKNTFTYTTVNSVNGLITLPADFLHLLSIVPVVTDSYGVHDVILDELQEDKIATRTNSQLDPPSQYPFFIRFANKTVQLWPKVAGAGVIYYLRKPATPKYAYTLTNGRPLYDPVNSIQLEWNEAATEKIIWKALGLLGINTADPNIMSISQAKEAVKQ